VKVWRVQHVRWGSTCINFYGREEDAKKRIDRIFLEHLLPGLLSHLEFYFGHPEHEEHIQRGLDTITFVKDMLDVGNVWGAYARWQDLMRWNADYNPQLPLWVEAGHVIVDAAELAGPMKDQFFPVLQESLKREKFPDPRVRQARRR
jgi:hypothetical protein